MAVNDTQIGGNHYKQNGYQHWDFVIDTKLHYILGCATKYITRWQDKNGLEDLRKSLHYLSKAQENNIVAPFLPKITNKFCDQLNSYEAHIIINIMNNDIPSAITQIENLISNEISNADKNYIDQDRE